MKWKVLPSMPKPNSHIEFAWVVVNNSIVIVGGTTEKHPETKKMVLNGEVVQFNLNTLVHTPHIQSTWEFCLHCCIFLHTQSLMLACILIHILLIYTNNTKKYFISVISSCYPPLMWPWNWGLTKFVYISPNAMKFP